MAEQPLAENRNPTRARQREHRRRRQARVGPAELDEVQQRGQALASHGDGDADDDLIETPADAEQQHDERGGCTAGAAGEKAEPERARVIGATNPA